MFEITLHLYFGYGTDKTVTRTFFTILGIHLPLAQTEVVLSVAYEHRTNCSMNGAYINYNKSGGILTLQQLRNKLVANESQTALHVFSFHKPSFSVARFGLGKIQEMPFQLSINISAR